MRWPLRTPGEGKGHRRRRVTGLLPQLSLRLRSTPARHTYPCIAPVDAFGWVAGDTLSGSGAALFQSGGLIRHDLDDAEQITEPEVREDLLALDEALTKLSTVDPEAAQLV
jgi:hypothetical protein